MVQFRRRSLAKFVLPPRREHEFQVFVNVCFFDAFCMSAKFAPQGSRRRVLENHANPMQIPYDISHGISLGAPRAAPVILFGEPKASKKRLRRASVDQKTCHSLPKPVLDPSRPSQCQFVEPESKFPRPTSSLYFIHA